MSGEFGSWEIADNWSVSVSFSWSSSYSDYFCTMFQLNTSALRGRWLPNSHRPLTMMIGESVSRSLEISITKIFLFFFVLCGDRNWVKNPPPPPPLPHVLQIVHSDAQTVDALLCNKHVSWRFAMLPFGQFGSRSVLPHPL